MKIEFKKDEMIVTHPSGHVDRYQQMDLEMQKVMIQEQIEELEKSRTDYAHKISSIQTSLGA